MKNQNLLWAISGGRCEYEGCNTPLYMDILTKKKYNKAYIAHIVADSLDGPRGDPERSEKLANEISNLMLLCDPHHTLIDKDVANHPEDRLVEMKRKHEERIARITAIAPEKESEIILYGANIGKHASPLSYAEACRTLTPNFYPASSTAIEIGLKNSSMTDCSDAYWNAEETNLCEQVKEQILPRMRRGEAKHYSVFALAPQPLLIKFGTMINDLQNVRVYQKHREPNTWKWLDDGPVWQIELIEPSRRNGIPALVIGLSATVQDERIIRVLGDEVGIWRITIPDPNNDSLRNEASLSLFRQCVRRALDTIKARHGLTELHVFRLCPLLPQSSLAEFGCLKRICP